MSSLLFPMLEWEGVSYRARVSSTPSLFVPSVDHLSIMYLIINLSESCGHIYKLLFSCVGFKGILIEFIKNETSFFKM